MKLNKPTSLLFSFSFFRKPALSALNRKYALSAINKSKLERNVDIALHCCCGFLVQVYVFVNFMTCDERWNKVTCERMYDCKQTPSML